MVPITDPLTGNLVETDDEWISRVVLPVTDPLIMVRLFVDNEDFLCGDRYYAKIQDALFKKAKQLLVDSKKV